MLTSCNAFDPPFDVTVPPPEATAPPLLYTLAGDGEVVVDPVSDVVPGVDPIIADLVSQVSQQQLMAYVRTLESFGTRNSYSDTESETFGIGAARRWLMSEYRRVGNGRLEVYFDDFQLSYAGLVNTQRNVVAMLPGTDPAAGVILLMGHYDTRPRSVTDGESLAPGANDNASGQALLLESARLLSSQSWPQTIIFLSVAAEEQGTFGSRNFAQNAFLDNMNILAVINYDVVGGRTGIPQSIRLFAPDLLQSRSGELGRFYEYIGGLYVPTFPVTVIDALDREGRYGDHREFYYAGYPAIRLTESIEDPDMVNSLLDRWDRIDYNYLQKVVQLNVAVAANLAGGPPPPAGLPQVGPVAESGAYQVVWSPSETAAGYAVSFRPLTSTSYPTFRFVRAGQAGNVAFTGLGPAQTYAVSITALDENGRMGPFTPEVLVGPSQVSSR